MSPQTPPPALPSSSTTFGLIPLMTAVFILFIVLQKYSQITNDSTDRAFLITTPTTTTAAAAAAASTLPTLEGLYSTTSSINPPPAIIDVVEVETSAAEEWKRRVNFCVWDEFDSNSPRLCVNSQTTVWPNLKDHSVLVMTQI